MAEHSCPRCGLESRCSHGNWADRHPAAAATAGMFTLVWMSMMLSVYPLAALTLIALSAVGGAVYKTARERRRREALVARADYEHHALMAAPPVPVVPQAEDPVLLQVNMQLPTQPQRIAENVVRRTSRR